MKKINEEYLHKIFSSTDEHKHHEMIELICEMMDELDEEDLEEVERRIYELAEGTYLNKEKAEVIIRRMRPDGMKWSLQDTENVRNASGYTDIRPVDFWVTMNMAYNDYKDIFGDKVDLYAKFSKDFILDDDAVDGKVYYYFTMVPKKY